MGSDVLRRVRWGNVGRAGAAVAVLAAVVAWPRLTPPQPRLPDPAARPLIGGGVERERPRADRLPEPHEARPEMPNARGGDTRRRRRKARRGDATRNARLDNPVRRREEARRDDALSEMPAMGNDVGPEIPTAGGDDARPETQRAPPAPAPPPAAPAPDPAQTEFGIEQR